jgi:hypothetical protein
LRGLSPLSRDGYVGVVSRLARHYGRSPDLITNDELKAYVLYLLRDQKRGRSTLITNVSALRFFYHHVLHRAFEEVSAALPRMKKPLLRSRIYSPEQVTRLLQAECLSVKHRTLLMILPERFVKIRHYGLLSNRNRHSHIEAARAALPQAPQLHPPPTLPVTAAPEPELSIGLPRLSPHCHQQADWVLVCIQHPPSRATVRTVPYLDSS